MGLLDCHPVPYRRPKVYVRDKQFLNSSINDVYSAYEQEGASLESREMMDSANSYTSSGSHVKQNLRNPPSPSRAGPSLWFHNAQGCHIILSVSFPGQSVVAPRCEVLNCSMAHCPECAVLSVDSGAPPGPAKSSLRITMPGILGRVLLLGI